MPEPYDAPTLCFEASMHFPVSGLVVCDLPSPVRLIGLWNPHVAGATMPETTVNEDSHTLFWEGNIGCARHPVMSPPASDVGRSEYGDEPPFGLLVAARMDTSHDLGPLLLCEHVCHRSRRLGGFVVGFL